MEFLTGGEWKFREVAMKRDAEDLLMPVEKAGLLFRNPFIIASGPASKTVEQIQQAEQAGWGGLSIKLTFDPEPYINPAPRYRWLAEEGIHIFSLETRLNLQQGLRLVEAGRKGTKEIVILANITYVGEKGLSGWAEMAKQFEEAGAHAIELNFCCPNMSFNLDAIGETQRSTPSTGASLGVSEPVVFAITKAVKESVHLPVFAKLTPEGGNIGEVAQSAIDAGADGVCTTANRLGVPALNIYHPQRSIYRLQEGTSLGCISGPWLKPLALKDVLQMRKTIGPDPVIIGTGGVHTFREAVEMALVGADLIGVCTAVMLKGFGVLSEMVKGIKKYLRETGRNSFSEIRDGALPYFKPVTELILIPGQAEVREEKCVGCGRCVVIAHCEALEMAGEKAVVRKEKCLGCSTCVDVCPKGAIAMVSL
ncbi:MAG TPA: hypothetical protein EYP85_01915 [Armatimonadetes bacterium]|nr:hypothetical protein [Armatimonadota bacterium]